MKILAFCFFPAFTPVSNGGQSRLYNFYRTLSKYHSVTLLTSTHLDVEEEVVRHGANFIERRIPKDNYFVEKYISLEQVSSGGDLSGPAIAACGKLPTLLHKAYLEEYAACDAVFHDSPFTADYDFFAGVDNKLRIYNSYNCESTLYRQLHPSKKSQDIHNVVIESEKKLLEFSDLVLFCNESDLKAFKEIAPTAIYESVFAPNGMVPIVLTKSKKNRKNSRNLSQQAVFMGSGHPPNIQAAKFIVEKLAPKCPEIIFNVIGSCLPDGKYASNVKRYGIVDDATKNQLLAESDFALNPMGEGSGSNVKVLEYFAYGLPVITTQFGMRGINAESGKEYFEATFETFVSVLKEASTNPKLQLSIRAAGKEFAEKSYTWDSIARVVNKKLIEVVEKIKSKPIKAYVLALNDYDSFAGIGGGCTRTKGLYENAQSWRDVVFVSFSSDGSISARKYSTGITVINVPKTTEHLEDLQYVNSLYHVSADDIIAGRHAHTNPWLVSIYGELRKSARCIVAEHCYLVSLPLLFGDRFVHSSQNNETELKKRLLEHHPLATQLISEVKHLETLAVECSALTIAVSQEDAESLVKKKRTSGPVIVVRNGSSAPMRCQEVDQTKDKQHKKIGNRSVVFLGSAHMPNIEAAQVIVSEIANECPDVRFHILGSVCAAIHNPPSNVILWGVVDEVTKSAVMQSCSLALNPMLTGSGSNVKQADYLGNGLFVISTEFGQRGYPVSTQEHVKVTPIEGFSKAILEAFNDELQFSVAKRNERSDLFDRELSMHGLAQRFTEAIQGLEKKRKRVLYVAYRYTSPAQGGAEINIEKFVEALGNSDEYDVDVISPEISSIHNEMRFSEHYSFDDDCSVPVNIPNVRFARFKADQLSEEVRQKQLRATWSAQVLFEKALHDSLKQQYKESGIAWGWAYPSSDGTRWAFSEFGLFAHQSIGIKLEGFANETVVVTAYNGISIIYGPEEVSGSFSLTVPSASGEINFITSRVCQVDDPRPLSVLITKAQIGERDINLTDPTLMQKYLQEAPADSSFYLLDAASENSRTALNVKLTDGRGPWSNDLENFISNHVAEYDLVVAHNNVFKPAVFAMAEAKKHGVPSILIPHAHLDDDFYHFPDLLESARDASQVLAVPKAACDFYKSKGCAVTYMPAGYDSDEKFTIDDQNAFQAIYTSNRPFVLVLGRKAGAKGYHHVIEAVEQLNQQGVDVQVVVIGPDDDGVEIQSANAVYLGRQPRNIVRGALLSCVALVNMSTSESFGIVLLEAWLAGKPVIANIGCAAFHDMAVDNKNSLLVNKDELPSAIDKLLNDHALAIRLADEGRKVLKDYSWNLITNKFISFCEDLIKKQRAHKNVFRSR